MASTRIEVDQTKPLAVQLLQFASLLRAAEDAGEFIVGALNRASSGNAWGDVEAALGSAGDTGQDAWTLASNALTALGAPAIKEFYERVGRS